MTPAGQKIKDFSRRVMNDYKMRMLKSLNICNGENNKSPKREGFESLVNIDVFPDFLSFLINGNN